MKKIYVLLVLLAFVVMLAYLFGRWSIYPAGSPSSKYSGNEQVVEEQGREYLVDPKENGKPLFVREEEIALYPRTDYNITEIPEQTELLYATGRVRSWEQIEGSSDLYLVLSHGKGQSRYRVSLTLNDKYPLWSSYIAIERVGIPLLSKQPNKLEKLKEGKVVELGQAQIKRLILPGDAVTVLSHLSLPTLSARDENGEYLADRLIIRRMGGI